MVRIGLVQMRCEKAAIRDNLAVIAGWLDEAKARRLDIIGFPEMSITGYADPTRYPQAVITLDGPEIHQFLKLTRGHPSTVLAGLIEANTGQLNGIPGLPFITQIAARDGVLLGVYRKLTIQDEEAAWFSPGDSVPVFHHGLLTFGIAICADIDNESVFAMCARRGAQIVFELAAPGLYGEQSARNWQSGFDWWRGECREKLGMYASRRRLWIAVATQAGRTVDEDFPGGGFLFSPDGACRAATPDWSSGALYLELELENNTVSAIQ